MNKYLIRRIIATIIVSIILVGLILGIITIVANFMNWVEVSKIRFAIMIILTIAMLVRFAFKEFQK